MSGCCSAITRPNELPLVAAQPRKALRGSRCRATMPRMSYARHVLGALVVLFAFTFVLATTSSIGAQAPRTVQDGVFSDAQATRGQALYAQRCAGCHGPALAGASAPALTGDLFTNKFRMEPLSALF